MTVVNLRNLEEARRSIRGWLVASDEVAAEVRSTSDVEVFDVVVPSVGLSGDQIMFTARWSASDGPVELRAVIRLEPTEQFRLFPDTNFEGQYQLLRALGEDARVRVPKVLCFVDEASVLGSRFYVMEMLPGRAAQFESDWCRALDAGGLERLWWNGLEAMAQLHRVDPRGLGAAIGSAPTRRPADVLDGQVAETQAFYESCRGSTRYPATEDAYAWLVENKPTDLTLTVQWGDARPGNALFDDQLACHGLLDWEQSRIGFAEADLGWWLTVDGPNSLRHQGMSIKPNLPADEETVAAYERMLGRTVDDLHYWRIFASARVSPILIKLDALCERHGFTRTNQGNNHSERALVELLKQAERSSHERTASAPRRSPLPS